MFYTFKQWDVYNCKVTKEMSCLHKAIVMHFLKKKKCVCVCTLCRLCPQIITEWSLERIFFLL